ncbi:HNH endonuclease [Pseudanabaena phage Pan5]|nr:HNH endonuclease [Pseudanabaena phage Pan5]
MENEIWKDVPGYEGMYQVSNYGRVKSLYRKRVDTLGRIFGNTEKIIKPRLCRGYYIVGLYKNSNGVNKRVNVLVAQSFCSSYRDGMLVNHLDGNKLNNHISNLEPCTPLENLIHALDLGLRKSKLTKQDVFNIKTDTRSKAVDLAKKYSVCPTMISRIKKGKAYKRYLIEII